MVYSSGPAALRSPRLRDPHWEGLVTDGRLQPGGGAVGVGAPCGPGSAGPFEGACHQLRDFAFEPLPAQGAKVPILVGGRSAAALARAGSLGDGYHTSSTGPAAFAERVPPIRKAAEVGQSIWYDNVRRALLTSGELVGMVEEDGLGGVTSNPSIFEKAISGSKDYTEALAKDEGKRRDAGEIRFRHVGLNQRDQVVFEGERRVLIRKRPKAGLATRVEVKTRKRRRAH